MVGTEGVMVSCLLFIRFVSKVRCKLGSAVVPTTQAGEGWGEEVGHRESHGKTLYWQRCSGTHFSV